MKERRTYWHLESSRRKPSEYDVATSRLLYYPSLGGFEVQTPIADWYRRYQHDSPLQCIDWEAFRDPGGLTYSSYTQTQRRRETVVDGLLQAMDTLGYDRALPPQAVDLLGQTIGPLRYPFHGLQMVTAYVGSMAPSGRLVVALAFQAADELRRVQRFAYRMRQLQDTWPAFGADSKARWERDPRWQPLRKLIEQLLVTYDWGEALIALAVVAKPAIDELFLIELGARAAALGDTVLREILLSLYEDGLGHRRWIQALVKLVVGANPAMRGVIETWVERWWPRVAEALAGLEPIVPAGGVATRLTGFWSELGLKGAS